MRQKSGKKKNAAAAPDREEWAAHTGKFILGLGALFLIFTFLLSLVPLQWFEEFYARGTLWALGFFGFSGSVGAGQEPAFLYLDSFALPLGFSYLCTGLLEMALVWSAVLASFGIDLRKRAIGAIAGTAILVAFNFVRIISSVLIISLFGLDAGNFAHDIFFRAFLFVTVAGFYWKWFGWATGKNRFFSASGAGK